MPSWLFTTEVQLALWLVILAAMIVAAVFVVRRFRDESKDDQPPANQLLAGYREMRERGDITEEEYRRLKQVLSARLQSELNIGRDKG